MWSPLMEACGLVRPAASGFPGCEADCAGRRFPTALPRSMMVREWYMVVIPLIDQLLFLFPHGKLKIDHALGPGLDHGFNIVGMDVDEAGQKKGPVRVYFSSAGVFVRKPGCFEISSINCPRISTEAWGRHGPSEPPLRFQ